MEKHESIKNLFVCIGNTVSGARSMRFSRWCNHRRKLTEDCTRCDVSSCMNRNCLLHRFFFGEESVWSAETVAPMVSCRLFLKYL